MGSFIIEGGYALSVSIRPQGAKDEVLEVIRTGVSLMIAAMSADGVGVIGGVEQTGRATRTLTAVSTPWKSGQKDNTKLNT